MDVAVYFLVFYREELKVEVDLAKHLQLFYLPQETAHHSRAVCNRVRSKQEIAIPAGISFELQECTVAGLSNKKAVYRLLSVMLLILVENIGFEPITSSLPAKRSSQMS